MKLLRRLVKQEHLYTEEKLIEMKKQLRVLEEELADLEKKYLKDLNERKTDQCDSRCGADDGICCPRLKP